MDSEKMPPTMQEKEIMSLQERLRVSDEWNIRLQSQLQELLRLPRNEVEKMRERMENPDIAIPLLQCYDAAIQEKQDENDALKQEVANLKASIKTSSSEQRDLTNAVKVAEEFAKTIQEKSKNEASRTHAQVSDLKDEIQTIRQELARALEAEASAKSELEKERKKIQATRRELEEAQQTIIGLESSNRQTLAHLQSKQKESGETAFSEEAQKIQLQMLTRENEDKLQELEKLRSRMVQALRQATENHNAHLKVLEERHAMTIEELRTQAQTQEAEVLKLRAQLARLDPSNPIGSASRHLMNVKPFSTTTEILELQTRQAQEMELKRLYAEVASLQLQRDEALMRSEQVCSELRHESDRRLDAAQKENELLSRKVEENHDRYVNLEREWTVASDQIRTFREKCKQLNSDLLQSRQEKEKALRRVNDLQKQFNTIEMTSDRVKEEAKNALEGQRACYKELEKRMDEGIRDIQREKERCVQENTELMVQLEKSNQQVAEITNTTIQLRKKISEYERDLEASKGHHHQLQEALNLHKSQVLQCDTKIQQLQFQIADLQGQKKELMLAIERLKIENTRLGRSRDKLIEEFQTRAF